MKIIHVKRGKRSLTYLAAMKFALKHVEKGIVDIFIKALKENDADKILELAQAVAFFKDKRRSQFSPVDYKRTMLLMLKARIDLRKKKLKVRYGSDD